MIWTLNRGLWDQPMRAEWFGGAWLSDDGGDRWTCVNAHLPPIHAVRWI